jgi:hypothetical protein
MNNITLSKCALMKNKFLLLTWLLALPLLWGGCDKPLFQPNKDNTEAPEELPPITTTGENTFGCLVNGEVWLPAGPDRYNRGFDEGTGQFAFGASRERPDESIGETLGLTGKVDITSKLVTAYSCGFVSTSNDHFYSYAMDTTTANELIFLRVDIENNIASGTFEFTAVNEYPPYDTVHVTQGRFDFNY